MQILTEIEAAFAAEAAAHARAAAELNPFGDAESIEMGSARLVYSGALSPVHGVFGLGLDGPPEENDWQEIDRFFLKKERAAHFAVAPFTNPEVLAHIEGNHQLALTENIGGWILGETQVSLHEPYLSGPDHSEWMLAFARTRNAHAKEPDLLSFTKLHQKSTRFYLLNGAASYTFFHQGIALVPYPAGEELLALQKKEAEAFRSRAFIVKNSALAPTLYQRKIYEPV